MVLRKTKSLLFKAEMNVSNQFNIQPSHVIFGVEETRELSFQIYSPSHQPYLHPVGRRSLFLHLCLLQCIPGCPVYLR